MNARETVETFFELICQNREIDEFESMIQMSYRVNQRLASNKIDKSIVWDDKEKKFVSNKDRSKIIHLEGWQNAVRRLIDKKPKSYRIIKEKEFGVNMISFEIEVSTRFMKLLYCYPNAIREGGTWYVNPISALPQKKRRKRG